MLDTLADNEQLALESFLVGTTGITADENLAHDRFDIPGGPRKSRVIARHIAPAEEMLPLFIDDARHGGFASRTAIHGLRQEYDAAGIGACHREGNAEGKRFLAQKRIGQLQKDACAIAE